MRLPPSAFSVLLVCVAACGKSAKECKTDAEALGTLLHDTPHEPEVFMLSGRHLVMRPDLPVQEIHPGPVVDIRRSETSFQGELISSPADLTDRLATLSRQIADGNELRWRRAADPGVVYFVIDDDVPWERVVNAFDAAEAAGMTKQTFVFEAPTKLTPPPRTAIDIELDKLRDDPDGSNRATRLANMLSDKVSRCKSLVKLFGQVAASEGSKSDIIIDGLPEALVECQCNVDMAQLRSLLWRILATEHETRTFGFTPGPRDETIAFPATTTWAEASKKLVRPLRSAKLVVQ